MGRLSKSRRGAERSAAEYGTKTEKTARGKRKRSGIQRRWLRNILSLIAAGVVVAVSAFAVVNGASCYSTLRAGLESNAYTVRAFLDNSLDLNYSEYYSNCVALAETYENKNLIELQFVEKSGKLVASSYGLFTIEKIQAKDVDDALASGKTCDYTGNNPATGERIMAVSMPVVYSDGRIVGVLRFVTSTKLADQRILLTALLALAVGMAVLALVYISSKYYFRSILVPVSEITETAKRIAAGSYGVRIQKKYNDEIGELADTVNDMSAKIAQSEKMQSEFMSSVSHELRTPLTAITGWGETLLSDETMDPAITKRGISIILRETRRLTSMVEELLEFTRMQDGRFTLNVRPCDLRADFEDTVFMYGSRLDQEGITLNYEESDDEIPELPCDPERMRQVFLNILDNAAKHGGEGKRIDATIRREGDNVAVRIRDYGPGIPEEELPHVKMKFYKGSSKARGSGIGLAVCEEIVTMHGGELTLENAEGGGTLVTVRLPIPEDEA